MWLGKASLIDDNYFPLQRPNDTFIYCLFSVLKKNYKKYMCNGSSETNETKFEQHLQMTYTDDENDQGVN